jgi:hypothetical protein
MRVAGSVTENSPLDDGQALSKLPSSPECSPGPTSSISKTLTFPDRLQIAAIWTTNGKIIPPGPRPMAAWKEPTWAGNAGRTLGAPPIAPGSCPLHGRRVPLPIVSAAASSRSDACAGGNRRKCVPARRSRRGDWHPPRSGSSSATPRDSLLPHSLKCHLDVGRCWMGSSESILFALAFCNVLFQIFPAPKIEGDRPINLLEAQCRIV